MRIGIALAAALLLAACGKLQPLKPVAGQAMPPKPANAPQALTVDQLLERSPQTRPERVDDVLRKSEERRDDHFDLPPAG
jgi:hypothetical protein